MGMAGGRKSGLQDVDVLTGGVDVAVRADGGSSVVKADGESSVVDAAEKDDAGSLVVVDVAVKDDDGPWLVGLIWTVWAAVQCGPMPPGSLGGMEMCEDGDLFCGTVR